ncbi:hypothetical protein [Alishewanella sp. SMS8]|uniref:hypothetical protein n=1 Tax=Alishewanella sp. SMS8 TaxID=2994676 RepID=UPI002741C701|nr:hypothetical protein [Alishewanella sp. SMS8]MDP5460451.1 hypothetical protein [Alishewanella sp. SMS8]
MKTYFIFTRKQRASARLLVINAGVAFLLYVAAHHYLPQLTSDKDALTQLLNVLDIAIWVIEAVLLGLALWFWLENKQIRVCVTPSTLSYFDPTFSDVGWQVKMADIAQIKQVTDAQQNFLSNVLVLKNGEQKQLMYGNYRGFDRRAFFEALVLANPNIMVPDNIYSYKMQKPAWAKRIRKKLGWDE